MLPYITKRSGSVVECDESKIKQAILNVLNETPEDQRDNQNEARKIAKAIIRILKGAYKKGTETVSVEFVQDLVEQQLMSREFYEEARKFILYREEHNKARNERRIPESKTIEDYIFTDKYARYLLKENRRETFEEAVNRSRKMHIKKYPEARDDIDWAFDRVLEKKCLPSMRSLQFGGKAIEKNNTRIYNCAYSHCDRPAFFKEMLFALLCGTGCGFSVEFEHVEKLPVLAQKIDESVVKHWTIEDSLEGWADALGALMDSYIGGYLVEFNYSKIRPRGSLLKTSGGKAPGHVPLRRALENIRRILDSALGRKLQPIECYDIVMYTADAVISGGVRRSACITLFSMDDGEMMHAKTGNWFQKNPQRARSNNSVKMIRKEVTEAQFKRVFQKQKEWGEPGFFFAEDLDQGINPCAEISLNPVLEKNGKRYSGWQFCNLTEINGAKLKSKEAFQEAVKAATILGTLQAGYTDFDYLGDITKEICDREALLGVSITGIMDSPDIALDPVLQKEMAKYAIEVNKAFAKKIGINQAARVTCVKPSGTASLVLNTASGIHPRHARRYFRRVQANTGDNVYQYFKKHNPHMCEQSLYNANNTDDVITFCVQSRDKALVKNDFTAIGLLEEVLKTQNNWVKGGTAITKHNPHLCHNVSNTIAVKDDEWQDVADFIWKNRQDLTGVTTLPAMGDKLYPQAPHEEVNTPQDEARWNEIIDKYQHVDYIQMDESEDNTDLKGEAACAGGACELI